MNIVWILLSRANGSRSYTVLIDNIYNGHNETKSLAVTDSRTQSQNRN